MNSDVNLGDDGYWPLGDLGDALRGEPGAQANPTAPPAVGASRRRERGFRSVLAHELEALRLFAAQ